MSMFGISLEEAARLHGHKGPWLVLGYRAGMRAREVLGPRSEHDMVCVAMMPTRTPYTCSLDGVQAATSCTLGKLSLGLVDSRGSVVFMFIDRRSQKILVLKLREETIRQVEDIGRREGLEEAAKWVEEAGFWGLFEEKMLS